MTKTALLFHPDSPNAALLARHFSEMNITPTRIATEEAMQTLVNQHPPEIIVIDIHHPDESTLDFLTTFVDRHPDTLLIFTTNYPDAPTEKQIQDRFTPRAILHAPFTRSHLQQVLSDSSPALQQSFHPPKVRVPVRMKLTLPYLILALILAVGAAYVLSQVVLDTIEERFTNQLIEAGKLSTDWLVSEEDRLLETERLIANTTGLADLVAQNDAEGLREMVLPMAVNAQEESVEILDTQGTGILSLRHIQGGLLEEYAFSRGDTIYSRWDFVAKVQQNQVDNLGDKYGGFAFAPWGTYLYVAGPIKDTDGNTVGILLVGKTAESLVREIRQDTLAQVTLYDVNGNTLVSTLPQFQENPLTLAPNLVTQALSSSDKETAIHPIEFGSISYSEIVSAFNIRHGLDNAPASESQTALIGAALAKTFLVRPSKITRLQIFLLTAFALALIVVMGFYLANRITRPLLDVVDASSKVADGNLDIQVKPEGDDEIAVLAYSFNEMVLGLRDGYVYRDLFGRTVSPEVREELRRQFAAGAVHLEGQEAVATVLMSDIRGFTTLAETETPTTIMSWLNEYFEVLVPVISRHGGVISKFEGDAVLAFFGVLPTPLSPQQSAEHACYAALDMLEAVEALNARRVARGEPRLGMGIGVNTGPVTCGALGSTDRLQYTIIGDTVNTTARLEGLTRQFGEGNIAILSQHTIFSLREARHKFNIESMGVHNVKGKIEQLIVFQLHGIAEQELA